MRGDHGYSQTGVKAFSPLRNWAFRVRNLESHPCTQTDKIELYGRLRLTLREPARWRCARS